MASIEVLPTVQDAPTLNEYKVEWDDKNAYYYGFSEVDAREQWEAQYSGPDADYLGEVSVMMTVKGAPPKISELYTDSDIETLIAYVEAAEPFIAIDGAPECGCDEWSICTNCAQLAEDMARVMRRHGHYFTCTDGEMSIEARDTAERLYIRYCNEVGRTPVGITM